MAQQRSLMSLQRRQNWRPIPYNAVAAIATMLIMVRSNICSICMLGTETRGRRLGTWKGIEGGASSFKAAAVNGTSIVVAAGKQSLEVGQEALLRMPEARQSLQREFAEACYRAGGRDVVVGAAAAGGTCGLCLGALFFSGELPQHVEKHIALAFDNTNAKTKNRTVAAALKRFRRGFRRRLAWMTVTTAAATSYLCTLPIESQGGSGLGAKASGIARRLGRAAAAASRTLLEEPPPGQYRGFRRWVNV
eukprot:TRINITY_DN5519_c5_g1_i1.p1 TRINITY_DN5519_c5_g1~~TRINITY_DN5519_c5_g1_i1.p1  ORF type:complete len:249 (+),score=43.49 TRINITY_DN5519_c5_g1_i1:57-803(+)